MYYVYRERYIDRERGRYLHIYTHEHKGASRPAGGKGLGRDTSSPNPLQAAKVVYLSLSISMYIYIYVYIYIYMYICPTYTYIYIYIYIQCVYSILVMLHNMILCCIMQCNIPYQYSAYYNYITFHYGQFSKCHVCFCGLDSGNLKLDTVRTNKRHICFQDLRRSIWNFAI